jgi:hypothetical protein
MQKYFSPAPKDKKINCPPIESLTIRLSLSSTSANNNEQFIAMRALIFYAIVTCTVSFEFSVANISQLGQT